MIRVACGADSLEVESCALPGLYTRRLGARGNTRSSYSSVLFYSGRERWLQIKRNRGRGRLLTIK